MDVIWNPWHGCIKYSEGCRNCYVYRRDATFEKDSSEVKKNRDFDLPIRKNRAGEYKIPSGTRVYACMTSDFFLPEADEWRSECWDMIRERKDLKFMIITKRIVRFEECKPDDWGYGWDHVTLSCTIENQKECDVRFPVFNAIRAKHKNVTCEPLLGPIDMRKYLNRGITLVVCGGESGSEARVCDYNWVLDIRQQCIDAGVFFYFKQTGAKFRKDGKLYRIERRLQMSQARKAKINT